MRKIIDSSVRERVAREVSAHNESDVLEQSYKLKDRFHHIWCYPSRNRLEKFKFNLLNNLSGKDVLDYGCGWGDSSLKYYNNGANVTGIDVSEKFIKSAVMKFQSIGCEADRYRFIKMDAHALDFSDESFDFIVGDGILHHLDAKIALSEIYRVLKPDGRVILFEPLAGHPLLKIFRLLTPNARTIDEAPLTGEDLNDFSNAHPWNAEHHYCGIFEAPVAMLTSIIMPNTPENWLLKFMDKIEVKMIENRVLLSWNQYVLLNFKK